MQIEKPNNPNLEQKILLEDLNYAVQVNKGLESVGLKTVNLVARTPIVHPLVNPRLNYDDLGQGKHVELNEHLPETGDASKWQEIDSIDVLKDLKSGDVLYFEVEHQEGKYVAQRIDDAHGAVFLKVFRSFHAHEPLQGMIFQISPAIHPSVMTSTAVHNESVANLTNIQSLAGARKSDPRSRGRQIVLPFFKERDLTVQEPGGIIKIMDITNGERPVGYDDPQGLQWRDTCTHIYVPTQQVERSKTSPNNDTIPPQSRLARLWNALRK